jgi:hypothetical protein
MERIDIQLCRWLAGLTVSFLIELTPVSVGIDARTPSIEPKVPLRTRPAVSPMEKEPPGFNDWLSPAFQRFFLALRHLVNWSDQKSETPPECTVATETNSGN